MLLFCSCIQVIYALTPHILAEHLRCVSWGLVCPGAQRWPHRPYVGGAVSTWSVLLGGQACCVLFEDNTVGTHRTNMGLKNSPTGFHCLVWGLRLFCHSWLDYVGFSVVFREAPCSSMRVNPGPLREQRREALVRMLEPEAENARLLSRGFGDKGFQSCRRAQPLRRWPKDDESWGDMLSLLCDIHSSNLCTEFFEYDLIPSLVTFMVFQLNTRKIWKCTHIYCSGFPSGRTLPFPQHLTMSGDVWGLEGQSHWHLVRRGQECSSTAYKKKWSTPNIKGAEAVKLQLMHSKTLPRCISAWKKKQEEERKKNEAACNMNLYIPAGVR